MPRTKKQPEPTPPTVTNNGAVAEVMTLSEAATYLRLPEDAVRTAIQDQDLPGRCVNGEWRFLKSGIQEWLLRGPKPSSNKEAWRALVGMWKDDPTVDELREEIARQRRTLMPEDE